MLQFDIILNAQSKAGKASGSSIIKKYNQLSGTSLPLSSAWCAATVSVIMRECGIPENIVPNFCSCTQFMNWSKQHGILHETYESGFTPRPADIILFDWDQSSDADHVGIVCGFDGQTVYTIEGNSNNQCRHREYKATDKDIRGYARPDYPNKNWSGIDISTFQKSVNYSILKSYGIDFAILRSSLSLQGSHKQETDAMLNKHYTGLSALNIPIGYYHYSTAVNTSEAESEAEYMVTCVKNKRADLPLFMDVEDPQLKALGKDRLMSVIQTFKQVVESHGYTFGLYTGKQFTDGNLIDMTWIRQHSIPLWYAQYHTEITSAYKKDVDIWQFNSGADSADYKIRMPFIGNAGLDVNISFVDPKSLCKKKAVAKNGWVQESGKWYYYDNNIKRRNSWIRSVDGKDWYYIKSNGVMAENEWFEIKGYWYRFAEGGKTLRGWFKDGKDWFYLNENESVGFPECSMQTGWKEIVYKGKKSWYYFEIVSGKTKGRMYSSEFVLSDGKWYFLMADGTMCKNKIIVRNGVNFKIDQNGVIQNPVPEKMTK